MKPVVLLIAGMLNDAEVWADVRPALADRWDARVQICGAAPSIAAVANSAWDLLGDVAPDAPIVIVGFSMGGYVAIDMLARPRRAVHAAVLVSTSAQPESAESAAMRARTIGAFRGDFPKAVEFAVQWNAHNPSDALTDRLRRMMLRVGAETAIRQTETIMARSDHRAALARLALPTQVICGAADRVVAPSQSHALAALIPGARLQVIDGVGHMLPFERPQAVVEAVGALLA